MKIFNKQFKVQANDALLPKTRKELFKQMIKEDFSLIVDISFIGFLFSIPLVIDIFILVFVLSGLKITSVSDVSPLIFICSVLSIPCCMIKYMGRTTLYSVMKDRVHNCADFLTNSFKKHFKDYLKTGLVNGLLVGIGYFIMIVGSFYFLTQGTTILAKGLGTGVSIVICFILFISTEYHMSINCFYDLKISEGYKNSFIFLLADLFVNLLYFLILVIIPIILVLLSNISFYILLILFCLVLEGLSILFMTLRSHKLFDKFINNDYYPEMVNKGLYKEI